MQKLLGMCGTTHLIYNYDRGIYYSGAMYNDSGAMSFGDTAMSFSMVLDSGHNILIHVY